MDWILYVKVFIVMLSYSGSVFIDAYPYYEIPTRNLYAEDSETQCEDPPNICPFNNINPSKYSEGTQKVFLAGNWDDHVDHEDYDMDGIGHLLEEVIDDTGYHNTMNFGPSYYNNASCSKILEKMSRQYPQCSLDDAVWYHTVILISLDGFHPKYLALNETPVLMELINNGTLSTEMLPTFPTYTFPNHMTLVTGLYPDLHGIVNNEFCDITEKKCFNKKTMMDPCWYKADPLWNTVQDFGIKSASVYWIGSEVCIQGRRPNYVVPFRKSCGGLSHRIEQLSRWLDLPPETRPTFLSCYISTIDDVGHASGPESENIRYALRDLNTALTTLIDGLKKKGVYDKVSIIVVSDHGMQSTGLEYFTYLDDLVPFDRISEVSIGPVAFIRGKTPEDNEFIYSTLKHAEKNSSSHFTVHRREELIATFNYGNSSRVSDIAIISDPHYQITLRSIKWTPLGLHGYPLPNKDMHALFISKSPLFRNNFPKLLGSFPNLDVYPFLCKLLDIPGNPCNGTSRLADLLL